MNTMRANDNGLENCRACGRAPMRLHCVCCRARLSTVCLCRSRVRIAAMFRRQAGGQFCDYCVGMHCTVPVPRCPLGRSRVSLSPSNPIRSPRVSTGDSMSVQIRNYTLSTASPRFRFSCGLPDTEHRALTGARFIATQGSFGPSFIGHEGQSRELVSLASGSSPEIVFRPQDHVGAGRVAVDVDVHPVSPEGIGTCACWRVVGSNGALLAGGELTFAN